ncbi:EAL domain-containing protein [uncultured Paracoccus sp.]|uniref:EAL domain-containing protein n=1 Tax=uncultured Paracoccus sp. TaxID=189685 RepID=UPI002627E0A1|nr:EAL domain-containing protein [uncultured Paracoccus sp.]
MRYGSLIDRWCQGFGRIGGSLRRPQARDRIALLLKLENMDLLGDRLGRTGLAHLFTQLSLRMIGTMRPHDFVQCASPGVFTILLRTRSEIEAMRIARRLQLHCQSEAHVGGTTLNPVISGVLVQNLGARHVLLRQLMTCGLHHLCPTDPAHLGRIRLIAYDERGQGEQIPATVEEAAQSGQIEAFFQPQICCDTGAVTGFEALARWHHPSRGLLTPMDFMPGMHRADHGALTLTMLRQCLAALQLWDAQGWGVETVSLNVAQSELSDPDFVQMVLWELECHQIARGRLVIEVLESIGPINSGDLIRWHLQQLAQAGCLLDLDDFGTGYANLESLRHFGVNRIKIDRCFVTKCHGDRDQQRMIRAILALAEQLGISTLAEGVESAEEHSYLAQMGCGHVQGYAIARPMPITEIGDFMSRFRRDRPTLPDLTPRKAG